MPRQKPRHLPTAEANFERWLIASLSSLNSYPLSHHNLLEIVLHRLPLSTHQLDSSITLDAREVCPLLEANDVALEPTK